MAYRNPLVTLPYNGNNLEVNQYAPIPNDVFVMYSSPITGGYNYINPLATFPYARDYFEIPIVRPFSKPVPRNIFTTEGIPLNIEIAWRKELMKARTK